MAKQTFTTGQVLTAAQMTSLQQTAMLGGAASAKTASYTLVAADAGTAISMSNASATTITVNTGLFAAGDTVQITNLGAGVCTITAGTATVNTSASLALAQYESGTLDFTSTSAAIFIKGAGAAGATGASYSLLNSGGTSLTGSSVTVSGISGKETIYVILSEVQIDTSEATMQLRINSDSTSKYEFYGTAYTAQSSYASTLFGTTGSSGTPTTQINLAKRSDGGTTISRGGFTIQGANSTGIKTIDVACGFSAGSGTFNTLNNFRGIYTGTSTVSSITILTNSGNFSAGTVYVYTTA